MVHMRSSRLPLMEPIRIELSMKCDSSELYGATENPFAVIAGRLARISRGTRWRQRKDERMRGEWRRKAIFARGSISSTKASLSRFSLSPFYPSFCALTLCTLVLFTKPLVRYRNLNSFADTAESNCDTLSNRHND